MKNDIKETICKIAPNFELNDILFPSFTKTMNAKLALSASDTVYLLSALLNMPKADKRKCFSEGLLLLNDQSSMQCVEHVGPAIEFQKNLMQEAQYLIEKKAIVPCREFRYALIKCDNAMVQGLFRNRNISRSRSRCRNWRCC